MKELILGVIKGLLGSKKFVALILGLIAAVAARLNLPDGVATEIAAGIIGAVGIYINAQGNADKGKEAAKIVAGASS